MGINMRYVDLLKKVPENVEVVMKGRGNDVIINVRKHVVKRGLATLPSMF
ncbi:MAG: hypothetical protein QXS93_01010 [Candidatus Micrarchaeia archaeon]